MPTPHLEKLADPLLFIIFLKITKSVITLKKLKQDISVHI